MKVILLVGLLVAITQATPLNVQKINKELNDKWEHYKVHFEKKYDANEEVSRRIIWEENVRYIDNHNQEYKLGKHKYDLAVNEFCDLTNEEYVNTFLQTEFVESDASNSIKNNFVNIRSNLKDPVRCDWRRTNCVTPVGKQKNCKSGYAFASIGALEGQYCMNTKKQYVFSKQQLIDCSTYYGNQGCSNGTLSKSFAYLADHGVELEEDYSYNGFQDRCKYESQYVIATPNNIKYIKKGNQSHLLNALCNIGPIATMIDASSPTFQFYNSGIYYDYRCSQSSPNHGVLVVGYDSEGFGNYWIVKNSFGSKWGLNGYIYMSADIYNMCGIAADPSVAMIE